MELNLRAVDLNLLPVFVAAFEERSLSRAALRLAMTQSATSHALGRLRVLFRDDLFIRHSRGMTPTPIAEQIFPKVQAALASVRAVIQDSAAFNPATAVREFAVAIPHPLGPSIALQLKAAIASTAPGFSLHFKTGSRPADMTRDLHDGSVDLALDWLPAKDAQVHSEQVFEDHLVAVARADHPLQGKRLSPRDLHTTRFVTLQARATGDQRLEAVLAWMNFPLRIELEVSEFLEVLVVVHESDLVGLIAGSMLDLAERTFGVKQLQTSNLSNTPTPVYELWHSRRESDPAHQLLRAALRDVLEKLCPRPSPVR
jgi:DNA-binding transcriptional LysR family regulator